MMGTRLLFHVWISEAYITLCGGGGVKEHPEEPKDASYASTWPMPAHRLWMMQLPQAHRHHMEQGAYGALGVKPTCLRVVNLGSPEFVARDLRFGRDDTRVRPGTALVGLNAQGHFRTAAAKEYPPKLAQSLAYATVCGLARRIREEGVRAVTPADKALAWFLDACQAGAHFSARSTFLPDYQR